LEGKECVFIWCNADNFVRTHVLKGLYSGMFISEVSEARMMGLPPVSQTTVTDSNNYFARALGQAIRGGLYHAYNKMKSQYEVFSINNIVAQYNVQRLYLQL